MENEKEQLERPELEEKLSELEILKQSIEEARAREKKLMDQLLRLGADYENFRKRAESQIIESRYSGREDILISVISLGDALQQADLASQNAKDVEPLKKGLSLVRLQFEKFLGEAGLLPIKSIGEKLDPHQHEVIAKEVREDIEEGTIIGELQRGYTLRGHIVRPARVSVASLPEKSDRDQTPISQMNQQEEDNVKNNRN